MALENDELQNRHAICPDPYLQTPPASPVPHTLLLLALRPVPSTIRQFHSSFNDNLRNSFQNSLPHSPTPFVHLYPPENLHITIATLDTHESSTVTVDCEETRASKLHEESRRWASVIDGCQYRRTTLELDTCTVFDDGVAVLLWKETENNQQIPKWRADLNKIPETSIKKSSLRTPNIIHSTFLRWKRKSPPSITVSHVKQLIQSAFARTKELFQNVSLAVNIDQLAIVEEFQPCLTDSVCHHVVDLQ